MHHKYVVRDGESVWTGSTNWTTDSWTLQENVIVVVGSPERGGRVRAQLRGAVAARATSSKSGREEPRTLDLDGRQSRAWFTPGHGEELSHRIARAIGRARERVRIASPVLTAGPVIGTLAEVAAEARVDLRGVVDRTQLEQVFQQWRDNGRSAWKIPILASVLEHADFRGKPSTRYTPDSVHDFMHAKVTVADDWVFAGSFNLSRSGERNAENVLEVHDAELADRLAAYIDAVRERYERMPGPDGALRDMSRSRTSSGSSVTWSRSRSCGRDLALGEQPLADPVDQPAPVVGARPARRGSGGPCRSGSA